MSDLFVGCSAKCDDEMRWSDTGHYYIIPFPYLIFCRTSQVNNCIILQTIKHDQTPVAPPLQPISLSVNPEIFLFKYLILNSKYGHQAINKLIAE